MKSINQFSFDSVNLMLVDPDLNARNSIRLILTNNGFRELKMGRSLSDIKSALSRQMPDILISEAELPDGDVDEMIHQLRHHELGSNPFLPVVTLTMQPTAELVAKVINSGADDLVPKPISAAHMIQRIEMLVRARKPFVVTSEYIGPDRRNATERESDVPLVDVPNILRSKAMGESEVTLDRKAIDNAIAEINLQKLERHAVQIGVLVELIVPAYEQDAVDEATRENVQKLVMVAEDTSRRLVGTKFEHISELCASLVTVVGSVAVAGDEPSDTDLKVLPELAKAINKAFDVKEDVAAIARKISAAVDRG